MSEQAQVQTQEVSQEDLQAVQEAYKEALASAKFDCNEMKDLGANGDAVLMKDFFSKYCDNLKAAEATISSQAIGLGVGTPVAMAGGAGASFAAPLVARFLKGLLSK